MDTVWREKSQGPYQVPTAVHAVHSCHFIYWAVYPSESIHVTSKLSQIKNNKTANDEMSHTFMVHM